LPASSHTSFVCATSPFVTVGGRAARAYRRYSLWQSHCRGRANGAGKSTLLRAILGWLPLTAGEIRIGDATAARAARLAYCHNATSSIGFSHHVREVVEQGRYPALRVFRRSAARSRARRPRVG